MFEAVKSRIIGKDFRSLFKTQPLESAKVSLQASSNSLQEVDVTLIPAYETTKLQEIYGRLRVSLDSIGNFERTGGPFKIIGSPGDFYARTRTEANNSKRLQILRIYKGDKGQKLEEYMSVSTNGDAEYSRDLPENPKVKETGRISDSIGINGQKTFNGVIRLADSICACIENPAYQHDEIRTTVKDIREGLVKYLKTRGIEYKTEVYDLQKTFPNPLSHTGEQPTPLTTGGHVYQNISLPGMPGTWTIRLDIDDLSYSARAYNSVYTANQQKIASHGIGLILTHKFYDEKKRDDKEVTYRLWEDGDVEVYSKDNENVKASSEDIAAFLTAFDAYGEACLVVKNSHLALMMASELEEKVLRRPSKIKLAALAKDLEEVLS